MAVKEEAENDSAEKPVEDKLELENQVELEIADKPEEPKEDSDKEEEKVADKIKP